mmetsp:Transcript_3759/g.11193  ORF Transcript_3759/g.11193 Transcript_3759/m.11193 type:complete len:747 (+) Transcript_3759:35-2275(+)
MNAGNRLSSFLSLHPRLVQLVTVTPVAAQDADLPVQNPEELHLEKQDEAVKAKLEESEPGERRPFDEAHLSDTIQVLRSYADACDGSFRLRRPKADDEVAVIEAVRTLAELVVWGDQNNHCLWHVFMDRSAMKHLSRIVQLTSSVLVRRQCLQSLSIMVQSIQSEVSLYNLFSRNYVNEIIEAKLDLSDHELVGHMVSSIRGITNRLDENLVQFFFDEDTQKFPLYDRATDLFDHREAMFRIAVRNATLSVYKLNDQRVLEYVTRDAHAQSHYFNRLFAYVNTIQDVLLRAFVQSASRQFKRPILQGVEDYINELESVLEYVNEAVHTNESNVGAFLGGAAIREFVHPLLFDLASFSGSEQSTGGTSQEGAGIFGWHLAICLHLLNHRLIGRALIVEVLSAFSLSGRTPCQGLKALIATATDERAVHTALCAMESLITYPLSEYDDLVAAGFAFPKTRPTGGTSVEQVDDELLESDERLASGSFQSDSGQLKTMSSSLSGYDIITGNYVLKASTEGEEENEDESKLNQGDVSFRELLGSIFRWERPTRSLRVAQAASRVLLAVSRIGGEDVSSECTAASAVIVMEYICMLRQQLEDDRDSARVILDALIYAWRSDALKRPRSLHAVLLEGDIVSNKSFHYPMNRVCERAVAEERERRAKFRHGLSAGKVAKAAPAASHVTPKFVSFDASCLLALVWLTAELRGASALVDQLEQEFAKAQALSKSDAATIRQIVYRLLEVAGGVCVH